MERWRQVTGDGEPKMLRRLVSGGMWNLVAAIAGRGFGLVGNVVTARILEIADYGRLGIIQNNTNTIAFIAWVSTAVAATKFIAERKVTDKRGAISVAILCLRSSILAGAVFAIGAIVAANSIASSIFGDADIAQEVALGSCAIIFASVSGTQQGILAGVGAFREIATISVVSGVVGCCISALCAWLWGLWGACVAMLGVSIVTCIPGAVFVHRELNRLGRLPGEGVRSSDYGHFARFAVPHLLGALVGMPVMWLCMGAVARGIQGAVEVALISSAGRIKELLGFLPQVLSRVAFTMQAECAGEGNKREARRILRVGILASAGATFAAAMLAIAFRSEVLGAFGEKFESGGPVLIWFSITAVVQGVTVPLNNLTTSAGMMWRTLVVAAMQAVAIVLWVMLMPETSALIYAHAYCAGAVVYLGGIAWLAKRAVSWV